MNMKTELTMPAVVLLLVSVCRHPWPQDRWQRDELEHTCQGKLLVEQVPCRLVATCGRLEPEVLDNDTETEHYGPGQDEDAIDDDVREEYFVTHFGGCYRIQVEARLIERGRVSRCPRQFSRRVFFFPPLAPSVLNISCSSDGRRL